MTHVCISIHAVRIGDFEDLQNYQGNPLITPVGHLYFVSQSMPLNGNEQGYMPQYQNLMSMNMGVSANPLFMNTDGAFVFDPANPVVATGTLHQLSQIIRKNYPEHADVRFISAGSQARLSVAHQGYNEIRDLGFTESIGVHVRFKKADGIWYVHNRTDNGWYRPTIDNTNRDFAPIFNKAVVLDTTSEQIQITFDDHGQMIGAEFLEHDDGNLVGFSVSDSNKIFEFVYPGEQMVFKDE